MSRRHLWPAPWHHQAKSSSCTQTQPFSHQCVSGGQRREALRARWLVRTRKQQASTESNHCGWSAAERARTPAVWSTLHISLQQHFFFLPPPPLWLIITHEKDQYSIIWPSAKLRQNQSALKKVWQTLFSLSLSDDPTQIGKGITLITVLDVNDNAPVFAIDYETLLCENAIPGQVRPRNISAVGLASLPFSLSPHLLQVWLTKTARWLSKPLKPSLLFLKTSPLCACSIHFTARGHSRETASLVWDTSLRFNSRYCSSYRSLEMLLAFNTVKGS